jgi:carbon-monoxide dehydrogenase small subunit
MTMADAIDIRFTLNGRPASGRVAPQEDAIDLLKRLGVFGPRESCGQGLCGCCTITVDGTAVSGCLTLARTLDGTEVGTVEGLDAGGELSVVQQAFIDEWAFQCGFCTPGFVMMTTELLKEDPDPDEQAIRGYLAGNLCRCATYPEVVKAVQLAAARLRDARARPASAA